MISGGPECGLQTRSRWELEWFDSTFDAKRCTLNKRNPEHVEVMCRFDEDETGLIACHNAYTILGYIIFRSGAWFSIS